MLFSQTLTKCLGQDLEIAIHDGGIKDAMRVTCIKALYGICVNKTKTQEIYLLNWDWHVLKRTFKTFILFFVTC